MRKDQRRDENPAGGPNRNRYPWDDCEYVGEAAAQHISRHKQRQMQERRTLERDATPCVSWRKIVSGQRLLTGRDRIPSGF
ncbi:hypothetical protein D9M72_569090 [compost metagenome]